MTDYGKWDAIASSLNDSSDEEEDPDSGGGRGAGGGQGGLGNRPPQHSHQSPGHKAQTASAAASPMASLPMPREAGEEFELVRWHCVSLLQNRAARCQAHAPPCTSLLVLPQRRYQQPLDSPKERAPLYPRPPCRLLALPHLLTPPLTQEHGSRGPVR